MKYIITVCLFVFLFSCNGNKDQNNGNNEVDSTLIPPPSGIPAPKRINYNIISEFPHDTSCFTEGLEFHNGKLYESGGDYINSVLQYADHKTGIPIERNKMGTDKIFGEGITILNGKIYQLTYRSNIVFVYDIKNIMKPITTFNWPYEGWGLTNNGKDLIIDIGGPSNLYFVDPVTFKIKNKVSIVDDKGQINNVNELEYIDGYVWANIWMTNRIIKIDPESGYVVGEMFMDKLATADGKLISNAFANTDVLNGIAHDSTSGSLFITGKYWPKLYEVKVN